jgi:hypothetical protein
MAHPGAHMLANAQSSGVPLFRCRHLRFSYLLGLGLLLLGQQLVRHGALHGAADAVDAVVRLLGREALEGLQDILVLLDNEIVGTIST